MVICKWYFLVSLCRLQKAPENKTNIMLLDWMKSNGMLISNHLSLSALCLAVAKCSAYSGKLVDDCARVLHWWLCINIAGTWWQPVQFRSYTEWYPGLRGNTTHWLVCLVRSVLLHASFVSSSSSSLMNF